MKIAVACDHAGFPLKATVVEAIHAAGHEAVDLGTDNAAQSVDYPDYAAKIGASINSQQADRGVLLCGSGVGAAIAANKITGVYAGLCHDTYSAAQGVEHDDMNVLCLGARVIGPELATALVSAFLHANFQSHEERHSRRVGKIRQLEQRNRS